MVSSSKVTYEGAISRKLSHGSMLSGDTVMWKGW